MTEENAVGRARAFVRRHRVRITRSALIAFGVLVLVDLSRDLPADTHVVIALDAEHTDAIALAIDVLDSDDAAVRSVRLRFPNGAPEEIQDTLSLRPGRYRVRVEAERADGTRHVLEGALEAPAEGRVRVLCRPVP